MRRFLRSAVVVLLVSAACGGQTPAPAPSAPSAPSTLSNALASGCFGWPGAEFSTSNKASVQTFLRAGDRAVEFNLRNTAGETVTLSGLLATRPVLLVHGAFT